MPASILCRIPAALALSAGLLLATACGGGGGGGGGGGTTGGAGLVDGASVTPSAILAAQSSFPGQFTADYVRRTLFTKLTVEVDYPVGHAPAQSVLDLIRTRLAQRCDKPGGVTISLSDAIPVAEFGTVPISVTAIEALEAKYRNNYADSVTQTAVLYIICCKGKSDIGGSGNSTVLAITYAGSSTALFTDVAEASGGIGVTVAEVEGAALVHEAGHALGLVNGGCPMVTPHEDASHAGHDVSSSSVMYWLIQISPVAPNIGDATFALYGANCEADLAAAGGLPASPSPVRVASTSVAPAQVIGTCGTCLLRAQQEAAGAAPANAAETCPAH